jgi:hypothetical protein
MFAVKVIRRISCMRESSREAKFIVHIKYDIPEITRSNSNGAAIVAKMRRARDSAVHIDHSKVINL